MIGLARQKELPLVIDADGLYIVTKNLDLVKGYPHAILTPNKNEYQRLADTLGIDTEQVSQSAAVHLMTHICWRSCEACLSHIWQQGACRGIG